MAITPLTTLLTNISGDGKRWQTDPDQDAAWHQFVLDHKNEILARATPTTITRDDFNTIRYDVSRFLRNRGISPQYTWVLRLINPRCNDITFTDVFVVYLPSEPYMKQLYEQYKASSTVRDRDAP